MGMYGNETNFGFLRNADQSIQSSPTGAVGPFQFEPSTAQTYHYPLTSSPNLKEFQQQANAAGWLLHANYKQFHNWRDALAAYNGGAGNVHGGAEQSYAAQALSRIIPKEWLNALGNPSTPGGTAGLGGTGTALNDTATATSGFQVGDTANPDEDYWTAINRIALERYWYVFSDGETLYLADGTDLMKQTPAADVDRVANAAEVNHLDFTWDNTAWQYAVTHRKRKRTQRRTSLAKVTSPVSATLDLVCQIDDVRAGDVVTLGSCGPGDGGWLVGNARRSVFEITSEVDMVIAVAPLTETELNPPSTLLKKGSKNFPTFVGSGGNKGYVNPVGKWSPSRIDAGVDGTLNSQYLAPGNSKILIADAHNSGWAGGGYIAGMFLDGSLKGKVWYVSEGVAPVVPVNAKVSAGQPVAQPVPSPYNGVNGNIETGWAAPSQPGNPLAHTLPGYTGDQSAQGIAAGNSFNRFLVSLGAQPGVVQGDGLQVTPSAMPPGYP